MPTGHARTAALLRSGHPGDLPVRRGHPLFGRRLPGDLACFPAGDCRGPGASPHAPAGLARGLSTWPSAPAGPPRPSKETLNTAAGAPSVRQDVAAINEWL